MQKDDLIPRTPQNQNYLQKIADRLNSQDAAIKELAGWAKEVTGMLKHLTDRQKAQADLLHAISQRSASSAARPLGPPHPPEAARDL